jgi:hypothetical protein
VSCRLHSDRQFAVNREPNRVLHVLRRSGGNGVLRSMHDPRVPSGAKPCVFFVPRTKQVPGEYCHGLLLRRHATEP